MFSHMKKKLILGALLAGACYMPCMAGSMDEVTALTEDPVVVYSFKPGDAPDVITNGLKEMGDWEKVKEESFSWDEEVEVTYTRKLDDEMEETLKYTYYPKANVTESIWVTFQGNSLKKAKKLYNEALKRAELMHFPKPKYDIDHRKEKGVVIFLDKYGVSRCHLTLDIQNKSFEIYKTKGYNVGIGTGDE